MGRVFCKTKARRGTDSAETNLSSSQQHADSEIGAPTDLPARFTDALDDDLNISAAWGTVFEWVRETNRQLAENSLSPAEATAALTAWNKIDSVLGIGTKSEAEVPAEISSLLAARQAARQAKDFKKSDAIRDELKAKGWVIEDTPKGPKLKKL